MQFGGIDIHHSDIKHLSVTKYRVHINAVFPADYMTLLTGSSPDGIDTHTHNNIDIITYRSFRFLSR